MGIEGVVISAVSAKVMLTGPGMENDQFDPAAQILSICSNIVEIQITEGTKDFD
jgi:hypothetical protein